MTVEVRTPEISYAGNGTTAPLAVPFRFLEPDHLAVTKIDAALVETELVRGADYTVAGAGAAVGGSITPLAIVPVGITWRIVRVTPLAQPTRYEDGYYSANAQETGLDRQMLALQETDRDVKDLETRSLRVRRGENAPDFPSTAGQGGRALVALPGGGLYWATITGDDGAFRADAGAPGGATLIGSRGRDVQFFLDLLAADALTPEAYGATGDGVATPAERSAMDACLADAVAQGKPILLTKQYNIGENFWNTGNVTYIGQGSDPRIKGAVIVHPATTVLGRPVEIDYHRAGTTRRDTLTPAFKEPFAIKSLWLGPGDQLFPDAYVPLDPAAMTLSINDYPGGDLWQIGNYGAVTDTGVGFAPTQDFRWYQAGVMLHGGMEITMATSGINLNRGVVVNCTSGTFGLYAADFNAASWFWKATGEAVVEGSAPWDGVTSHQSWIGRYLLWTLRIYDHQTIGVLVNGTEIFRFTLPEGHVVRGGFIGMRATPGASLAAEYGTAARVRTPMGGQVVDAYLLGDSKTETHQGDWADAFRVALDGSAGVRVRSVVNHAVSGQNSLDQLNVMTANPPTGASDVIIPIATNDIQAGATSEVTRNNLAAMLAITDAEGIARNRVHIGIPDLWYDPALAGGFGEITINYQGGSRTRAAMMNFAAEQGCSIVNMPQALGPVLGSQIVAPDASDPRMRDNIHPTVFTYRLMGTIFARSVLRQAAREMRRSIPQGPFAGTFGSGWSAGAIAPEFAVSEDGELRMFGELTPGATADSTPVIQFPMNMWPAEKVRCPAWTGSAWAMIEIAPDDGVGRIKGASGATMLTLDGIRFQTISLFS